MNLPDQAEVLIIGGGAVGCSLAYHLARAARHDVLLLERDRLTSGTTWHAAGIVGPVRASVAMTRLHAYASELFPRLAAETGRQTGYRRTGGFNLAQRPERMQEFRRFVSAARAAGAEAELVTPADIRARCPLLETSDLEGGVWIAQDAQTDPTDTTLALAGAARSHGARVCEGVRVTGIETRAGAVAGVHTSHGRVRCAVLAICCGMWSREVASLAGVSVPLQAVEHMYFVTEPIAGVTAGQPLIRDFDQSIYLKGDAGKLLVGGFDRVAKLWRPEGVPPDASFVQLDADWEHFDFVLRGALARVPALAEAGIRHVMTGPEAFTVDTRYCLGESAPVRGLYVAAGFSSAGIMASAGIGRALAEWIADGRARLDLWELDLQRFEPWMANRAFLRGRIRETVGLHFAMHWPGRQFETARNVRRTALHEQHLRAGACMGQAAAWERPLWFAGAGAAARAAYGYGTQAWWEHARQEASAARDAVALFELSPLARFTLAGPDALPLLQRLCANDLAVAPGRVVYTQMLNPSGGIEADLTVTRLAEDRFQIATGAATRLRDFTRIARFLGPHTRATLCDVTAECAVLGVMGPRARELLGRLGARDIGAEAFPFAHAREVTLGYASVLAQRVSFVGELGWELYIPLEFAASCYALLTEEGAPLGLCHAGAYCLDACRLEKGFRHFGHDLGPGINPYEAGLGFAVCADKAGGFIGCEALAAARERTPGRRLIALTVEQGAPLLLHDEPLYRDGERVGHTTSANFGFRLGKPVALAEVTHRDGVDTGFLRAGFELEVACERYPVALHTRPPYDPQGSRMRG